VGLIAELFAEKQDDHPPSTRHNGKQKALVGETVSSEFSYHELKSDYMIFQLGEGASVGSLPT
jgi:hypothetical protein